MIMGEGEVSTFLPRVLTDMHYDSFDIGGNWQNEGEVPIAGQEVSSFDLIFA